MKFVINAPKYTHQSGGIKVLYTFCDLLNKAGQQCRIVLIGSKGACAPDEIAIYPEVVEGNPLCARMAVRWCLNLPGFIGGSLSYDKSEVVFYFDEWIKSAAEVAAGKPLDGMRLCINMLDSSLFYNDGLPKSGAVFYNHRGNRDIKPPIKYIETTKTIPERREDFAAILRRSEILYSTYKFTGVIAEAIMCGCKCFVPGEKGWEGYEPDFREYLEYGFNEKNVAHFVKIVKGKFYAS